MKKGIGFRVSAFGLMIFVMACGNSEQKSSVSSASDSAIMIVENTSQPVEAAKPVDTTSIFGSYVGTFEAVEFKSTSDYTWLNLITIFIDSMSDKMLYGHSVVAGTSTPFQGEYTRRGYGHFRGVAREPGTGKYDGAFTFELDSAKKTLSGTWMANDTSLDVTKRRFELHKRYFNYDPNVVLPEEFTHLAVSEFTTAYSSEEDEVGSDTAESTTEDVLKFNPSTTLLTAKDVENMKRGDLEVMRNAIYARHGYTFRNRQMRFLFDNVSWYMPVSTDIRNNLTEIEKKNIELLKRYEEHAERYYDYFGR